MVNLAPSHGDLLPTFESMDLFLCLLPVIEHVSIDYENPCYLVHD